MMDTNPSSREAKDLGTDVLDTTLLAHRQSESLARRLGQTLQDFSATQHVAFADTVQAGVVGDAGRRAYHVWIRSGRSDHQINHVYDFVSDPEALSLDPQGVQDAVLRFYDMPWKVDRHR